MTTTHTYAPAPSFNVGAPKQRRTSGRPLRWITIAIVAVIGSPLAATSASADDGAASQCEFRGMIKALQQMALTTALHDAVFDAKKPAYTFDVTRDTISLVDAASGAAVLKVDCSGASMPDIALVKGRATKQQTQRLAGRTVSVTALGATSLDIDAGELFVRSFHVLTFDDGSTTLSFGADTAGQGKAIVLYSVATSASGDFIEKEHASVGCGCEKWVSADGQRGQRPLAPAK